MNLHNLRRLLSILVLLSVMTSCVNRAPDQLSPSPQSTNALSGTGIVTPPTMPLPAHTDLPVIPPDSIQNELAGSLMGIQGHFLIDDPVMRVKLLDMVAYDLRLSWVKQQIRWDEFETQPGRHSETMLRILDEFMDEAENRGLKVILGIAHAPDWAREATVEDGPPVDYDLYNEFVRFIVLRYKHKISAVEIWNEPNLRREWQGAELHGAEYVRLLAGAYRTIKTEFPEGSITVISAGLAPTGIDDRSIAANDRTFLHEMYMAGLPMYADAIGIHPYGWANPPEATCCNYEGAPPTHADDPSFFFRDTIQDYRDIQAVYGDSNRQLWATEFGWGSIAGIPRPVAEEDIYFWYLDEKTQGVYIVNAFKLAQQWDFMGPMILWNFNIASFPGLDDSQSAYSIMADLDNPRPSYFALKDAAKR